MWSIRLLGAAVCVWALSAACGGDGGDDGSDGTGGAGSRPLVLPPGIKVMGSGVTPSAIGECMSTADCRGAGSGCGELPSGYRVCTFQTPIATMPSSNPTLDLCDASRPCSAGACFTIPEYPRGICGNEPPVTHNVCRDNGCTSDAQCPAGNICGPPGFSADEKYEGGLIRQCIPAACKTNAECNKLAGGACALVQAGCDLAAAGTQAYLPAQMACVYPNGCASLSDCRNVPGSVCKVILGEGVCVVPE